MKGDNLRDSEKKRERVTDDKREKGGEKERVEEKIGGKERRRKRERVSNDWRNKEGKRERET